MQQGGSHYGEPLPRAPEAVPPISSRPPEPPPQPLNFDELATTVSGSFPEDEAAAADVDGAERGTISSNRWPRHETLALIKIRSDMDSTFREANLKAPLWEEVSRKLADQGITRSAKKCKEKFENVHKYYKRTKEGRAGRQDGKSYRFFPQLEAFHGSTSAAGAGAMNVPTRSFRPAPITSIPPQVDFPLPAATVTVPVPRMSGLGFSSGSDSDSETEEDKEEGMGRKRKLRGSGSGMQRTMTLFGEMMKKVMEQQEAMQQRFLDVIEKREQDRMDREEAWKRQEAARLSREHEMAAQERTIAASRDAAIIAFLQKISDQSISPPAAAPPLPSAPLPTLTIQIHQEQQHNTPSPPRPPQEPAVFQGEVAVGDPTSSRWPKEEVLALIDLRSGLDARYHDNSPKGPLWEEISARMRRLGYNRNAKRCKEKWENINKYFKKVKESNRKRPEDAKTCPYFNQLDAIYRSKSLSRNGLQPDSNSPVSRADALPKAMLPPPLPDAKTNGSIATGTIAAENKAAETLTNEGTREIRHYRQQPPQDCAVLQKQPDAQDSASISSHEDDDYGDDEEEDEEDKMAYKIKFQRPNMTGTASNNAAPNPSMGTALPPAATGSFVAIVQ